MLSNFLASLLNLMIIEFQSELTQFKNLINESLVHVLLLKPFDRHVFLYLISGYTIKNGSISPCLGAYGEVSFYITDELNQRDVFKIIFVLEFFKLSHSLFPNLDIIMVFEVN